MLIQSRVLTATARAMLVGAAIAAVTLVTTGTSQAARSPIPLTDYPAGAHISYRPALTNAQMDCMWGFFCEGNVALFHFRTQDEFHRVGGWGQFAGVQHHGRTTMAFELFVSRYDPVPDEMGTRWSERAFLDLKSAIYAHGYALAGRKAELLSAAPDGGTLIAVQRSGTQDLVVMALWSGTLEIEGIALYDHRPAAARQIAWTFLARQTRIASQRGA